MCGIIGFTGSNKNKIINSLKILKHRGPDDRGIFVDEKVSLGHTRLAILDLSKQAQQPMKSQDGKVVLLLNGEIYNFKELKKNLINKGYSFQSTGDTEVVLNGYLEYGINFFSKLRGMWAGVLYDKKKNILILIRDYFGIKPLYYAQHNGQLYFASEMKGITSLLSNLQPNTENFFQFFNLGYFISPQTCYRNIKKLKPGDILIWNFKKRTLQRIENNLIDNNNLEPNYFDSFKQSVKALNEQLINSVRAHFVSSVPVGLLLSGGTDSSLLAALSREAGFRPIAFNLNISNNIDSLYARKVSEYLGLKLIQKELSTKALQEQYEKVWQLLDEPFADISIIPTSLIFSVIANEFKVVLSGEGGDELFGGYRRNNFLAKLTRVQKNNAFIDLINNLSCGTSDFSLKFINPTINRLRNTCLDKFSNDILGSYLKGVKIIDHPFQYSKIRKNLYNFWNKNPLKTISSNLFFDRFLYLPHDLMYKADISSMYYSVETRFPFVDKTLFNFVINRINPTYCLSKNYNQKIILKKVLEKYLPKKLVYRPKKGFAFSFKKYPCPQFHKDVKKALEFHQKNAELFGLKNKKLIRLLNPNKSELLIKKYSRFAFGLVSNWKIFQKII